MRRILLVAAVTAAAHLCASAALAEEEGELEDVRVDVRVIFVEAGVARIDRGAAAGILPGDRILLLPLGRDRVETTATQVDDRATTVRFEGAADGVTPGVAGYVVIPKERLAPRAAAGDEPVDANGRPPIEWTSQENGWDGELPLLADAQSLSRSERAPKWSGFGYLTGDIIRDRQGPGRDDTFSRLGLGLRGENIFGRGGTFQFDGEFNYRKTDLFDGQGEDESLGRLDRLSYSWGGTRDEARRFEFGRFLPREYPELGLLDGAEVSWRSSAGHRYGASFGYLPSYDRERSTGDTLQVSSFATFALDAQQRVEFGGALQKTWTDGHEDRDLFLTRLRWSPDGPWSAYSTAWVDFYGTDDVAKENGAELTQLLANVTRRIGANSGVSLFGSIVRYPELLRDGLQNLPPEILMNGESKRVWVSGWTQIAREDRLRVRIDQWSDQESSGGGGELGWQHDFRGETFDLVDTSFFVQQSRFTDVYGVRVGTGGPLAGGRWRADLDVGLYEQIGFSGDQEELLQNAIRLGWDGVLGRNWFLSLTSAYRFGDEQDALSVGFLLNRSF